MAEKKKYTDIDLSKYDGGFKPTEELNTANVLKTNAENAVKNYGDFSYGRQSEYDNAMNAILNRKGFSYDLNGDALYQQYKDKYITQGKQASMDVMGQAAAMTGGYGNSYAQTVGQQTYQGYLQGLNDKIPELYQLALDRYNSDGDRLATNYGLLSSDRSNALAEHEAGYNKLVADRDYYGNEYNTAYNRGYAAWNDNRTYDTSQYWNEYNTGYKEDQDNWHKDQNDIAKKYSNYINPDDIEVDENGNITAVKGYNIAGSDGGSPAPIGNVVTGTGGVGDFNVKTNNNFDVEVGGKKYRVENHGKVTDSGTKNNLNKIKAEDGQVVTHNGQMYVKKDNEYYKIGATNVLWWETDGYKKLYAALNG